MWAVAAFAAGALLVAPRRRSPTPRPGRCAHGGWAGGRVLRLRRVRAGRHGGASPSRWCG
ncbi:hypothetical protein [Streptomyces sp. NPDC057302]|uniref:hypothetical protein n=1 Tax=Streptomyces sp. NPDC057302 TaxID=3346094 RepID=UPI00362B3A20